ncbi:MAG: NUDIX hydrolase [Gammaproteobacteria bacterium]|nr:MAG: NUDIX hydrolase [Gammaproteobacteria bacterium]
MRYCSSCGASVSLQTPPGDDRPRFVCGDCATIHYQNPRIITGCIPEWEDSVLLCRRAIEPRHGLWTLPAGFMENGETTAEGAVRETLEEANARVEVLGPFAVFDIPRINQVYLLFRARLLDTDFSPGAESLEVQLFREAEIPWSELAFPVIERVLPLYYEDLRLGAFAWHTGVIRQRRLPDNTNGADASKS